MWPGRRPEARATGYRREERIGAGPVGEVFRARLTTPLGFESAVALTVLRPELQRDRALLSRFAVAASKAAQLEGACAVRLLDLVSIDDSVVLVREPVRGIDLDVLLSRLDALGRPLRWESSLRIALEVCESIAAQGLRHLCLAPREIVVDGGGQVRVLDVGLVAPLLSPGWIEGEPELARFVAPETRNGAADASADVYSLCALLDELVKHAADDVPAALRSIVDRGMSQRAGARWPALEVLAAELRPLLHASAVSDDDRTLPFVRDAD